MKKKIVKNVPTPKHVFLGEFYGEHLSIDTIKVAAKKAGVKLSTVYIDGETDYSDCWYEGDSPSVKLKVYGTK